MGLALCITHAMDKTSAPELSIVIPMYNESEGMEALFSALVPVLDGVTHDWEILCINDGSTDNTLELLRRLHDADERVRYLSLSRNFGKEAALTAGLHHVFGRAVIPFDADLQDPPTVIPQLVTKWKEGYKVVLASRRKRDGDSFIKGTSAKLYYKLLRLMSVNLPENTGDFRLMDQQVVEVIRLLPERSRFMKGLFAWVGFSTTQIFFDRPERSAGNSKQKLRSLLELAKDGIFSFTTLPLRITTYLGLIISFFAFSYGIWLLIRVLIQGVDVPGYASIMAAVLCMGGIQLVSLGIIGEYLGRVYRESKQRPLFIIEEKSGI